MVTGDGVLPAFPHAEIRIGLAAPTPGIPCRASGGRGRLRLEVQVAQIR